MNERIKELFHESIEDCDGTMKDRVYSLKQSEIEKFAELIVRECISEIENIAESSNDPQPIYRVAVELLEHFGVEE